MNKLRWGILGAARIAPKNWKAIRHSGNAIITAVASRDGERARRFVAECQQQYPFEQTPTALHSYEELLASREVDAVYLPLPTVLRKEWVLRAAEAGKHVLCEKPCAVSVADLEAMLAACRKHRVQFMDGVMFMHNRRLGQIRDALDHPTQVGQIRRINTHFSFLGGEDFRQKNIRADSALEPLGCLGDLGWYCLRFTLWVMNWQMPGRVSGQILSDFDGGPPSAFSGELLFDGGASAGFHCSFLAAHQQTAIVSGTHGQLRMQDFVLPFTGSELAFETTTINSFNQGCDFFIHPGQQRIPFVEPDDDPATAQETNMFRNFAKQVLSGRLNKDWPEQALKTQRVANACLESARRNLPLET
jgi:predicted dehydrogenase